MKTLILYDSQYGNTKRVAEMIGMQMLAEGPVRVTPIAGYLRQHLDGVDLFLIGGPTQAHGLSPAMREFLDQLQAPPSGIRAAAFDTRLKGPAVLWGSAGKEIEAKLRAAGFEVLAPAASFLVTLSREPELHDGEAERAAEWASELIGMVHTGQLVAA